MLPDLQLSAQRMAPSRGARLVWLICLRHRRQTRGGDSSWLGAS